MAPLSWVRWLVDDQRFAADRTDVLTYTSEVLRTPLRIAGQPVAQTAFVWDPIERLLAASPQAS